MQLPRKNEIFNFETRILSCLVENMVMIRINCLLRNENTAQKYWFKNHSMGNILHTFLFIMSYFKIYFNISIHEIIITVLWGGRYQSPLNKKPFIFVYFYFFFSFFLSVSHTHIILAWTHETASIFDSFGVNLLFNLNSFI